MTTKCGRRIALASLLAATNLVVGAKGAPAATAKENVLVHGALTDGSSWRGVYDILTNDGFRVRVAQEPLTSLAEDVAATKRVIDQLDGPVVLVGHSYGGTIITVAGADPKVTALVYVAALQPDVGETTNQLGPNRPTRTVEVTNVAMQSRGAEVRHRDLGKQVRLGDRAGGVGRKGIEEVRVGECRPEVRD